MENLRVPPTIEDQAIYQRHLRRILRECQAADRTVPETMAIIHRWTLDYIAARRPVLH